MKNRLVSRQYQRSDTQIRLPNGTLLGGDALTIMAGPCAVESTAQIETIAQAVSQAGATVLRGGAFKPRTSPYSFQGLGEEGLHYLRQAADNYNLAVVTEATSLDHLPLVAAYADIVQIGARNMHNYALLQAVGCISKPVLLKRGLAATYEEFLLAAEYIMHAGNPKVILCERGVRSFEKTTRNLLDLAAVPLLQQQTHLPIIVDPSHATGLRELVPSMARAAVAAGAQGVMIEAHTTPDEALSDSRQTIATSLLNPLIAELNVIHSLSFSSAEQVA